MSKLKNIAGVFIVLVLSTALVNGQNRNPETRMSGNNMRSVINNISGLSASQKEIIEQLENGYQLVMGDLRAQMQSTADSKQKSALMSEMQQITQNHQNNIKNQLTAAQKKEYNKLLAESRGSQSTNGKGMGQGKGKGNGSGGMRGGGGGKGSRY